MKKKNIICLNLLLTMLLTGCRTKTVVGPKGDKGDTGESGLNGKDGKDGVNGKDGSKIYTGEGMPNDNTGVEGDLYIDTNTWDIYVKGTSTWSYSGNIKGEKGDTGSAGQNGNDGESAYQTWLDAGNTGSETDFLNWLKGSNGSNGVSVVNTYIDENGNLICELSNGQAINAGKVKDVSEATKYKVNFYFKETVIDTKEVISGSKVTPPESSLISEGYTLTGWYINEYGLKSPWTFNGCIVTSNLDIYADYTINSYEITYNLDGGSMANQIDRYNVEDEITLENPTKTGYTFLGWTGSNGETPVLNYIQPSGSLGDKNYTANWSPHKQTLIVTSNDETLGTVSIVSGTGYSGESITVQATVIDDNVFKGWYVNDTLVSNDSTYTFIMPTSYYSLTAKFIVNPQRTLGMIPTINTDENTITYGLYPQTYVGDTTLTTELDKLTTTESNGWYLYKGAYYAKLTASTYVPGYTFDDGTTIISGTNYWFKCELITWEILKTSNNEYILLSSTLLNTHRYGEYWGTGTKSKTDYNGETASVYSNNYKFSDVRTWLNTDFYNCAFALNNSYIQTTLVDNSASTTYSSSNSYVCKNTDDKVYLLSYKEYLKTDYDFTSSTSSTITRQCKTTDWARANGAHCDTSSSYKLNGFYWTRSPYSDQSYNMSYIDYDGSLCSGPIGNYDSDFKCYVTSTRCVRPSIVIKINN